MKKCSITFLCLISTFLIGCNKITDFSFTNPEVEIADNLDNANNETAHVVFLYGQSNADGVTLNEYLLRNDADKYNEYKNGYDNVYINYINDGKTTSPNHSFIKCTLGCGCAEACYGPEMGVAERMSKEYPNEKTFIIKWTWGGTTLRNQWLDNHYNRGELYNLAMDFSLKCLDYLIGKGFSLSYDGICWMQGENDSFLNDSNRYFKDTKAYVGLLRHDFEKYCKRISFIDAGINEAEGLWKNPKNINKAKKKFANSSNKNFYIDPTSLGLTSWKEPDGQPDGAHYDSISMVKLGQAFGDKLVGK